MRFKYINLKTEKYCQKFNKLCKFEQRSKARVLELGQFKKNLSFFIFLLLIVFNDDNYQLLFFNKRKDALFFLKKKRK